MRKWIVSKYSQLLGKMGVMLARESMKQRKAGSCCGKGILYREYQCASCPDTTFGLDCEAVLKVFLPVFTPRCVRDPAREVGAFGEITRRLPLCDLSYSMPCPKKVLTNQTTSVKKCLAFPKFHWNAIQKGIVYSLEQTIQEQLEEKGAYYLLTI